MNFNAALITKAEALSRIGVSPLSPTRNSQQQRNAAALLTVFLCALVSALPLSSAAESSKPQPPLPDVNQLLRNVTTRQKNIEKMRENYDYTQDTETKEYDGKGRLKDTKTEEYQIFFVNDKHIRRLVKRNGKPLDGGEEKKEQDRVNKEVEKASKHSPDEIQEKNSVSISHIIQNARWANPRRENRNGRSTIVLDFMSNPHAKTHGIAEDVFKELAGTVWIDEKDQIISRFSARFDQDFRMGGGLVASVHKGSTLMIDQGLINNEIWLPLREQGHFDARVLFKGITEDIVTTTSNYHKFSVETTQQTGAAVHPPA